MYICPLVLVSKLDFHQFFIILGIFHPFSQSLSGLHITFPSYSMSEEIKIVGNFTLHMKNSTINSYGH